MRNLNIICIEKDFVAWPCPGKTINLSDSRENQSNAILDQIQDFIWVGVQPLTTANDRSRTRSG